MVYTIIISVVLNSNSGFEISKFDSSAIQTISFLGSSFIWHIEQFNYV